jgi:hypothetical protein
MESADSLHITSILRDPDTHAQISARYAERRRGEVGKWGSGIVQFDGTTGPGATYVNGPAPESRRITDGISFLARFRCDDISRDAPILAKESDCRA